MLSAADGDPSHDRCLQILPSSVHIFSGMICSSAVLVRHSNHWKTFPFSSLFTTLWPSCLILKSNCLDAALKSVASRACYKLFEQVKRVKTSACYELFEQVKNITSRACSKLLEQVKNITSRAWCKLLEQVKCAGSRTCYKLLEQIKSVASRTWKQELYYGRVCQCLPLKCMIYECMTPHVTWHSSPQDSNAVPLKLSLNYPKSNLTKCI